ncbi:hypothetical protein PCE1_003434 [Barthelona sp. PCE]
MGAKKKSKKKKSKVKKEKDTFDYSAVIAELIESRPENLYVICNFKLSLPWSYLNFKSVLSLNTNISTVKNLIKKRHNNAVNNVRLFLNDSNPESQITNAALTLKDLDIKGVPRREGEEDLPSVDFYYDYPALGVPLDRFLVNERRLTEVLSLTGTNNLDMTSSMAVGSFVEEVAKEEM